MAYYVYCDDTPIYDLRDEELVLVDPKVSLELNKAGSFTFKLLPNHPQYDLPHLMTSRIRVLQDDEEVFNGRPISIKTDFYNRKEIECEGQLAFLNDSIQRPAEYHDISPREYLTALIDAHNSQVDESRQFEVGIVTVTDNNDSLYRYTNMNTTMDEIKEDLIDDLGGYLRVRNLYDTDGTLLHRYLDYVVLTDYGNINTQPIEFGENLLDFSRNMDMTDIATAVIPLGCTLDDSEFSSLQVRLTIADVNDGCDYLQIDEAVENYGFIVKTQTWDNVTTAQMLLSKAKSWLTDYQYEDMVIEAKAVDLHYTDSEIETFRLGDMIRVLSSPHGLDKYFPLTKMTIYLNKPSNNSITLGTYEDTTLSARTNEISSSISDVESSIPVTSAIVQQAVDQASALITAATHGYVVTTADEILIMNTDDTETATKVWRWNLNGLGYSSTGYNGTYGTAMTMDGQIVGDYIVANSIAGSKLSIEYTTQVENEIADAKETATSDANDYTDTKLTGYYTKSQVTTAIENNAESVILSAQENAVQYIDEQLQNYYTSSQIDVKVGSIETTVTQNIESSITTTLANYPTDTDLEEALSAYISDEDLDNVLVNYSTTSEIESMIDVSTDGILLEVSEKYVTTTTLANYPTDTDLEEALSGYVETGEIRSRFAMDSSSVTIESGVISFDSNSISINSDNFQLTTSGEVSAKGTFTAGDSSSSQMMLTSGTLMGYYDGEYIGMLLMAPNKQFTINGSVGYYNAIELHAEDLTFGSTLLDFDADYINVKCSTTSGQYLIGSTSTISVVTGASWNYIENVVSNITLNVGYSSVVGEYLISATWNNNFIYYPVSLNSMTLGFTKGLLTTAG